VFRAAENRHHNCRSSRPSAYHSSSLISANWCPSDCRRRSGLIELSHYEIAEFALEYANEAVAHAATKARPFRQTMLRPGLRRPCGDLDRTGSGTVLRQRSLAGLLYHQIAVAVAAVPKMPALCQKQNKTNTDYRVTLLPFLMTNNVNVSGAFRRDRAIIHCPSQSKAGGAAAIHSPSMSMATRKQAGDFTLLRLSKSPDVCPSGTTQGRTRCTVVSTVFHEGKDNSLDRRGLGD